MFIDFFTKSFLLYTRSEIGALFKKIPEKEVWKKPKKVANEKAIE